MNGALAIDFVDPPLDETKISLPDSWQSVELKHICEINPRRFVGMNREDSTLTTFVPMSAIDEQKGVIANPELRPYSAVKKGYTFFTEGDILFAKITPCMQNGKHAIARNLTDGIAFGSTEFHVIHPKPEAISEWIHFFLRQPSILRAATAYFSGAVGQQRVPDSFLASLEIPLPPLEEQKRIATILNEQMTAIENARVAAEEQLQAAKALPAAYFRSAFQGVTPLSINPINERAPKGWEWKRLTDIATLESGHTPSRYHPEWWGGDIAWIALPDIRALDGKVAYKTNEYTNNLGIANSSARILPEGTVVLSRTASVGYVTIMGLPMATSQDFVNWICGEKLNPRFLAHLLRASRDYILSQASGAVHKTVYMPTVKNFHVCIPSIEWQNELAEKLSKQLESAEKISGFLQDQLNTINKLPASTLRQVFRGEL